LPFAIALATEPAHLLLFKYSHFPFNEQLFEPFGWQILEPVYAYHHDTASLIAPSFFTC